MSIEIAQKTAHVVVCEDSSNIRTMISDCVKSLGFKEVRSVGSWEAGTNLVESNGGIPTWFITSINSRNKITGLNYLDLFLKNDVFNHVRCSVLMAEEEEDFAVKAYDLGALSHHPWQFTRESVELEVRQFLETITSYSGDTTLTAAAYLRQLLEHTKRKKALLGLETSLADLYPDRAESFLHLGKAQLMCGMTKEGFDSLLSARMLDKGMTEEVEKLVETYIPPAERGNYKQVTPAQALGLNRCVVVDPDSQIQRLMWSVVTRIGIPKIDLYQDVDEAWEAIKSADSIDLLVQEWKLPKISGPGLIQRIRKQGHWSVPVILLTDSVTEKDFPLLKEMGISQVVRKPIEEDELQRAIVSAMREERFPTQKKVMIRKVISSLTLGNMSKALGFRNKLLEMDNVTDADRKHIGAEFLFVRQEYEKAKEMALQALKLGGDSLLVLSLLGKCFMRLRDFDAALKCLNRAQAFSPANISRLCSIAEIGIETGDTEGAAEAIEQAKTIDEDNTEVMQSEAKLAMAAGDNEKARDLVKSMEDVTGMISYLNTKAVALTLAGDHDEARALYKQTLDILPDERAAEKSAVYYNLGLAATKQNLLAEAEMALTSASTYNNEKLARKIRSLLKRVEKAIEKGTEVVLRTATPPPPPELDAESESEQEEPEFAEEGLTDPDELDEGLKENIGRKESAEGAVLSYSRSFQKSEEEAEVAEPEEAQEASEPEPAPEPPTSADEALEAIDKLTQGADESMGKNCCHKLFIAQVLGKNGKKIAQILRNTPKFKRTASIKREASHGADRIMRKKA